METSTVTSLFLLHFYHLLVSVRSFAWNLRQVIFLGNQLSSSFNLSGQEARTVLFLTYNEQHSKIIKLSGVIVFVCLLILFAVSSSLIPAFDSKVNLLSIYDKQDPVSAFNMEITKLSNARSSASGTDAEWNFAVYWFCL